MTLFAELAVQKSNEGSDLRRQHIKARKKTCKLIDIDCLVKMQQKLKKNEKNANEAVIHAMEYTQKTETSVARL